MVRQGNDFYLDWENAFVDGNKIYFTDIDSNDLYVYDMDSQSTQLIYNFSKEADSSRLFGQIVMLEDMIYTIPFWGNLIYEIDKKTKKLKGAYSINIPSVIYAGYSDTYFLNAHKYGDKLFLTGNYPAVVSFDTVTKEMCYWDDWVADVTEVFSNEDLDNALFRKTLMLGGKIYAPLCRENAVVVFDVEQQESVVYRIGDTKCGFSSICYDGENFWLSPRADGVLVSWNEENNSVIEYGSFPKGVKRNFCSFNDCIYWAGRLWLIPGNANAIITVDTKNGNMKKIGEDCGGMNVAFSEQENRLMLYSQWRHLMWIVNSKGAIYCSEPISAPFEKMNVYEAIWIKKVVMQKGFIVEQFPIDLHSWIAGIAKEELYEKAEQAGNSKACGYKIYELLKEKE